MALTNYSSFPDAITNVNTYFFDASQAGPGDLSSVWTNDANAFDGDIATFATTTSPNTTYYDQVLSGTGTNAPSEGAAISQVRVRMYYYAPASQYLYAYVQVSSGGQEIVSNHYGFGSGGGGAWSNYEVMDEPTGGWTWEKVQNLVFFCEAHGSAGTYAIAKAEVEVTSVVNLESETDFGLEDVAQYTVTHTTDSLKRKQLTVSHTTDANKRVAGITKTHTTDSLKRKQSSPSHTTDSMLRKSNTVSHTTDAHKVPINRYWVGGTGEWSNTDTGRQIVDYHSETNANQPANTLGLSSSRVKYGQTFTGDGSDVGAVSFYLKKNNSPTGNAWVEIWSHTGTFGTSGVGSTLLATSDTLDVSTNVYSSFQMIEFTFSGAEQITLSNGTPYVAVLCYTGDSTNYLFIEKESGGSHPGNTVGANSGGTWSYESSADTIFYVKSNVNNWSYTSGGSPGAEAPTDINNVIIDSNSGFDSGGTIFLKDGYGESGFLLCNDFSSTSGDTYNVVTSNLAGVIGIFGSMTLDAGADYTVIDWQMLATGSGNTINTNGRQLNNLVLGRAYEDGGMDIGGGGGSWTLTNDIDVFGDILINNGTLDADTYDVRFSDFQAAPTESTDDVTINMGSGTWEVIDSGRLIFDAVEDSTITVNSDTSTLKLNNDTRVWLQTPHIIAGLDLYDVWVVADAITQIDGNNSYNLFRADVDSTVRLLPNTTHDVVSMQVVGSTISTEEYNFIGGGNWYITSTTATAQSFTTTSSFSSSIYEFYIDKLGTPNQDLLVNIYLADGNHKPTGSSLASGSVDKGTLSGSGFYSITLGSPLTLSASTEYVVVFTTNATVGGYVHRPEAWDFYPGGIFLQSQDDGSSWNTTYGAPFGDSRLRVYDDTDALQISTETVAPHTWIKSSGTINTYFTHFYNSAATGGATFNALGGTDDGGNSGWIFSELNDRYWVGGSGDWNDPSHWAIESGGDGGFPVPGLEDSVYFDNNSGLSGATITNIDEYSFEVFDFIVSTSAAFVIDFSDSNLNIYGGELTLQPSVTLENFSGIEFTNNSSANIDTAGVSMPPTSFYGGGSFTLLDNLYIPFGDLEIYQASLDANGFDITTKWGISITAEDAPASFDFSNSTITCYGFEVYENGDTVTISSTGSHIILIAIENDGYLEFDGGGKSYNIVEFVVDQNEQLRITGNNTISELRALDDTSWIRFVPGSTQTITTFNVGGSASSDIELSLSPLSPYLGFNPVNFSSGGANLVSNGTFTGNANDWTLGADWSYNSNHLEPSISYGSELLTNGSFTGNATGWTLNGSWTYSSNSIQKTVESEQSTFTQDLTGLIDDDIGYVLTLDVSAYSGQSYGNIGVSIGGVYFTPTNNLASTGVKTFHIHPSAIAGRTDDILTITGYYYWKGTIDDVSLTTYSMDNAWQDIGLEQDKYYLVEFDVSGTGGYISASLANASGVPTTNSSNDEAYTQVGPGSAAVVFRVDGTTSPSISFSGGFVIGDPWFDLTLDNVSVKEVSILPFTLSKSSGTVTGEYIYVQNNTVTGGARWVKGTGFSQGPEVNGWIEEATRAHSTDSFKRRELTLTHTTDSFLEPGIITDTRTHTTDSLLRKTVGIIHSTDSFLRETVTISHTTSSNKKKANNTASHSTDSLRRKQSVLSHTTDVLKRIRVAIAHTTDTLIRKSVTLSHTTNALLRKQNTVSHTTSSNKKRSYTSTHTADANKRKADNTVVHTTSALKRSQNVLNHSTDVLLRESSTLVHTTDAFLRERVSLSHSTDSFLRKQNTSSHTADANKKKANNAVVHTADSNKKKSGIVSHTTGSLLRTLNTKSHTTDTLIRSQDTCVHSTDSFLRLRDTVEHTTDSFIRRRHELSHTADANKRKVNIASHTADSLLRESVDLLHTTDSNKKKQNNTVSHYTDSYLRGANSVDHTTDANKKKAGNTAYHTTDANRKRSDNQVSHATDSLKRSAGYVSHTTDSVLRSSEELSHSTDSQLRLRENLTHATDSLLRVIDILTHTSDANRNRPNQINHATDANKKKSDIVSHTTDSNKRRAGIQIVHTTDSLIRIADSVDHTTDSNKKKQTTVSHNTSSFIRGDDVLVHTTDTVIRDVYSVYHTTDVTTRKDFTVIHLTDANKKKAGESYHLTDSLIKKLDIAVHVTDSLLRERKTTLHTTDAFLRVVYHILHSTDANKRGANDVSHTTDSVLNDSFNVSHSTDSYLINYRGTKRVMVNGQWIYGHVYVLNNSDWIIVPVYYYDGIDWVLTEL